jgi:hypothetical protein
MKEDTIWTPHDHTCSECGTTWHHDPIEVIRLNLKDKHDEADNLNEKSHLCPNCGKENYQIADHDRPPQFLCDGRRCVAIESRIPTVDTLETHTQRNALKMRMRLMRMLGGFA